MWCRCRCGCEAVWTVGGRQPPARGVADERGRVVGSSIYRSAVGRSVIRRWCTEQLDRWDLPAHRSVVAVDGADTRVVAAGYGPATVVFLPGTNFPAAVCGPIIGALADRCRVVAVDVPGQPGLSCEFRPPARKRLDWYGRWLTALLPQIAEAGATVVGWSMGAAIALSSSSRSIGRVVLVSPGGLIRLRTPPSVLAVSLGWLAGRRQVDATRLLRVMHGPGHEPRHLLVEWMTLVARHVRSSADPGVAQITIPERPYVAISGAQDRFLPPGRLGPALRRTLGIGLTTVLGSGHLLADEQAAEVARFVVS